MPRTDMIRIRRGTATEWTTTNPMLEAGEPGYEHDTGLMKVGNGVNTWNALPYTAARGPAGPQGPQGSTVISMREYASTTTVVTQSLTAARYYHVKWLNPATAATENIKHSYVAPESGTVLITVSIPLVTIATSGWQQVNLRVVGATDASSDATLNYGGIPNFSVIPVDAPAYPAHAFRATAFYRVGGRTAGATETFEIALRALNTDAMLHSNQATNGVVVTVHALPTPT